MIKEKEVNLTSVPLAEKRIDLQGIRWPIGSEKPQKESRVDNNND